jgi:hypothetical protein
MVLIQVSYNFSDLPFLVGRGLLDKTLPTTTASSISLCMEQAKYFRRVLD